MSASSGGQRSVQRLPEHRSQRGRTNWLPSKNFFLLLTDVCRHPHVAAVPKSMKTITSTFISLFLIAVISIQPLFGS